MVNIKKLKIEEILGNTTLEDMFQVDFIKQEWVWVNRDIFFDIVYNALEYGTVDEEYLENQIKTINDHIFFKILEEKFKKIGWISVDQIIFEKLVEDFISTKDIKTHIYINKKFYNKKIIRKSNELSWIFKAMAVDTYQHLGLENKTLVQIYEEYFNENGMIIEELLLSGEYRFNTATWKLDIKSNLLELYKMEEKYSQWSEGNSKFMFNELSK